MTTGSKYRGLQARATQAERQAGDTDARGVGPKVASDDPIEGDQMATIEIRIPSLSQLFDALDPAPLPQRGLEPNAERYILAGAGTLWPRVPLQLVVHLPETLRAHVVDTASGIHEHFRRSHARGERKFRRRMRVGGFALAAALGVLATSFGLRSLLSNFDGRALAEGVGEGLLILGWVAMWRPIEILLFEHWEGHLDHAMLERLASIPIDFVFQPEAARET